MLKAAGGYENKFATKFHLLYYALCIKLSKWQCQWLMCIRKDQGLRGFVRTVLFPLCVCGPSLNLLPLLPIPHFFAGSGCEMRWMLEWYRGWDCRVCASRHDPT